MPNNITEVHLLKVHLENDYLHTIYFDNASDQQNFFKSRTVKTYTDFSYQRKDEYIRIPAHYDDVIGCNYVMYKNSGSSTKWYYAFITDMKYVNEERTDVYIETDVMQTWLFDYQIKPSFVEREHVNSDEIGEHTFPEQLETGDYVINNKNKNSSLLVNSLIIGCTVDLNNFNDPVFGSSKYAGVSGDMYNGIFSGVKYYMVTLEEAKRLIKDLARFGQSDAIVSIFTCPSLFVSSTYPNKVYSKDNPVGYAEVNAGFDVNRKGWINTLGIEDQQNYKPTNINGYTPRNNKLFTYPYCYMLMSNNSGGSAVYKYELFNHPEDNNLCDFNIYSAITPGFSICISPLHYNNVEINSLEKLTLGKFPICGWNTDVYTNWLTQNAVNIPLSLGSAVATAGLAIAGAAMTPATGGASAIATVGAIGATVSGISSIAATVGEIYSHSLQPPQAEGNVNSGDVTFASGTLTFTAYQMTIKKEHAQIIDEYFDMFGYKVNQVKVPLKNHRSNWWYTKTIDVNIDGNIPMNDLRKIKACYNNGITFWRDSNIGDYSKANTIL